MNPTPLIDVYTNSNSIKRLRPRLSESELAWFHKKGLGRAGGKRRDIKNLYRHVLRHRLKADVTDHRALVTRSELSAVLRQHHDYPGSRSARMGRKYVASCIKDLERIPSVTSFATYILLDSFNGMHGSDEQIDAHHAQCARKHRGDKAAWAARERGRNGSAMSAASAKLLTSQPVRQIVESRVNFPLTIEKAKFYNASPPKIVETQLQQAAGFASRPKRAGAVSANRAKMPKAKQPLVSFLPIGKTLAQPSIPNWLKADVERPDFDPRTNPAARRIYGHTSVDRQFVAMLKREHKELTSLSYPALRRRQATVETLMAACHQLTRQKAVTKPVNWVMWMEKALRDGVRRYA